VCLRVRVVKIDASSAYILTLDRPENVTQSLQTRKKTCYNID